MKKHDWHTLIKWLSNSTLVIAMLIGATSLISVYRQAHTLPAGVCPYTSYRSWMYVAVALSIVALVLSFFEGPGKPGK